MWLRFMMWQRRRASAASVSRVINKAGSVRPSTYRKVKATIVALNDMPNDVARALSTKQSRMIGLIIPDITNPFYPAVARGVQDVCQASSYDVLMCNTDENPAVFEEYVIGLCNKQVDGLLV
jgi:LacI family transcriptional regulator